MWGRQPGRVAVVCFAFTAFVVFCLLPVGHLIAVSTLGGSGVDYTALLLDARQRGLLRNTALLGAATAILATAIGAPLGVALARISHRRKPLLRVALSAPALLPPYIVALAWVYLGGSRGVIATLAGRDLLSDWTYSLPGAILVLSLVFYPLSMLATEVALRRIDGRLEEAALLVAPPGRVVRRITLPMATPGILAATLLIFVLAISEFGVPGLLRVRVYTTEVFTAFAALYDFTRAVLLTLPLLLLCAVAAAIAGVLGSDRLDMMRRTVGAPPALFESWSRRARIAEGVALVLALGFPLAILLREAAGAPSAASVLAGSGGAITNSLLLAAAGATGVLAVAVWIGYLAGRAGRRARRFLDVLFIVTFAVPSTLVGVGLIGVWNRAGPLGWAYGTELMLLLGYLARFIPVAALGLAAATRAIPVSHEEAAALSGAGWFRTMRHVVLPQLRLPIAAAWVIVFVLAFGELGVSVLVAPPGDATLPIRIYTLIANTPPSHVAALALLQAAVIFVPLAALGMATSVRKLR